MRFGVEKMRSLSDAFFDLSVRRGINFYSGVPCSLAGPLFSTAQSRDDISYVGAVNEGDAVGLSIGAWLAGTNAGVICQNSGLANALNPVASLCVPYRIPLLLIVTHRGVPGIPDEPQHRVLGAITPKLLSLLEIGMDRFPSTESEMSVVLERTSSEIFNRRIHSLVVLPETFAETASEDRLDQGRSFAVGEMVDLSERRQKPTRVNVIERLLEISDGSSGIVSTTGKCSRELFTIADCERNFYVVGGMGCALSIGLGVALVGDLASKTIVLDGDGAVLMRMGTLATAGAYSPKNLIHVIIDNGAHESTGGQKTVSPYVDFAGVAMNCGYRFSARCDSLDGFEGAFRVATRTDGPALISVSVSLGSLDGLGRPTLSLPEIADRFRHFISKQRSFG